MGPHADPVPSPTPHSLCLKGGFEATLTVLVWFIGNSLAMGWWVEKEEEGGGPCRLP